MPIPKPPASAGHLGQGVAYPLAYTSNGRLALSSGPKAVNDAMLAIFQTQPGERVMQPDNGAAVGVHDPVNDMTEMTQAARRVVAEHEPRVEPESITVTPVGEPVNGKIEVEVSYTIIGETAATTLTFPYFVRS